LEALLSKPADSEAHVWKRRALDAEAQLLKNIETITALRSQVMEIKNNERDLYAQLAESEEERLRACESAGNLQLRLDASLAREGALNQRLSNLDILAREITERVTKMVGVLDNPTSIT
jgi:hypothetical protein